MTEYNLLMLLINVSALCGIIVLIDSELDKRKRDNQNK